MHRVRQFLHRRSRLVGAGEALEHLVLAHAETVLVLEPCALGRTSTARAARAGRARRRRARSPPQAPVIRAAIVPRFAQHLRSHINSPRNICRLHVLCPPMCSSPTAPPPPAWEGRTGRARRPVRRPVPRWARRLDGRRGAAVHPADLGLSTSQLQWIVCGYVLGYGGLAAARRPRRRPARPPPRLLIALGVFTVASRLGGLVERRQAARSRPASSRARRRVHRARRPVDHHDEVRRRPGPQPGAGHLRGDRRERLLARAHPRRLADRARLALDVPAAGPVRARDAGRRAARAAARRATRRKRRSYDIPGAVTMTAAHAAARPHGGRGPGRRLGIAEDDRRRSCSSRGAARGVRRRSSGAARSRWSGSASCARRRCVRANLGAMALFGSYFGFQFVVTLYLQQAARLVGDRDRAGVPAGRACSSRSARAASVRWSSASAPPG